MKELLRASLLALTLLAARPASSWGQTQAEMNQEAGKEMTKADAKLNKLYKQILEQRSEDPEFTAALKEAQRTWLKFVEAEMKVLFHVKEGENPREVYGSSYSLEFATAKTALIEARIEQLTDLVLE